MSVRSFQVAPLLAQGPLPESARRVWEAGFRVVVFCAEEAQPPAASLMEAPSLQVIRCPLVDDLTVPLPEEDWQLARTAATGVTMAMSSGKPALVTCLAGLNRSGLVTALVLCQRYGMSGREAVERVRLCRGQNALHNPQFVKRLLAIPKR